MWLRSLLLKIRYSRSGQECPETAGLIISERLKDLLASPENLNPSPQTATGQFADFDEAVEIEVNDPTSPAVKTAA